MAGISCEMVSSLDQFIDALRIRVAVFIQEQGFSPGWEPDEVDKTARHYIATSEAATVATARVCCDESAGCKIERMAVLRPYRGMQIGTCLTRFVIADIQKGEPGRIWLNSQCHATSFYERCGFRVASDVHYPCGVRVPHVTMEYAGKS